MRIHKYYKVVKLLTVMLVTTLALGSCKDDKTSEPYVTIKNEAPIPMMTTAGGDLNFEMYSNLGNWTIQVAYASDNTSWLDVYPNRGQGDGRFVVKVMPNQTDPYTRVADVHVVSGGSIYKTIRITQSGTLPMLELDMDGLTSVSASNRGTTMDIALKTNVLWKAEVLSDGAPWITLGNATESSQSLLVAPTPLDDSRTGHVQFTMVGTGNEHITTTLAVIQRGNSADAESAVKKTIAEVLTSLAGGVGNIDGNVYVEGYVISHSATRNFSEKSVFIQDESNKGLQLEFTSAAEAKYAMNSKLKVHLVGRSVILDPVSGGKKVAGLSTESILENNASATGAAPVEVVTLDNIGQYENMLVTLKAVEFAVPMGTYVNVDESKFDDAGVATSIMLGDTPRQHGVLLRDAKGNTVKMYSACTFTDRYAALMGRGSGSITGVVLKYRNNYVIRVRTNDDNKVSDNESTRLTVPLVQFGPYTSVDAIENITANKGNGSIRTSRFAKIQSGTTSEYMYWAWTYSRIAKATVDPSTNVATPEMKSDASIQNPCLNGQAWWNGTGTIMPERQGEAWLISLNTTSMASAGKLVLTFTSASSSTGPRFFTAEWAPVKVDQMTMQTVWSSLGDFEVYDWSSNYQLFPYTFELPDAIKGKQDVVIRLRVKTNESAANKGATIGGTGTNRLGFLSISEIK